MEVGLGWNLGLAKTELGAASYDGVRFVKASATILYST
ncbi:hypothetical protein ambt_15710 [Alteromonas naphthalenivorans]|uniref:Uncharacterized protein n=1 Tax=Alteromonas naphthalenivorans TaxID=715451 RepID=F5ZEV2_ALTNA|nr:hypothetical protein ambt_15710 [Alteromonas naphthalenivorans]